jgi:hypothetical protein
MPRNWPLLVVVLPVIFILTPLPALSLEGPLRVKNQFPLFLHLNAPFLEKAAGEDSLSLSLSYSSVFMKKRSADWLVDLDLESAEFNLTWKKMIPQGIELGLEIPFLGFSSGVLDYPLESYHNAFGFPDYGRSRYPKNQFRYQVINRGGLVVAGENGRIGPGDIRLTAKKELLTGRAALSLKGDLELPTGSPDTGFGNGSLDAGLSLIGEYNVSPTIKVTGILGGAVPGELKANQNVGLNSYVYFGGTAELQLFKPFEVIGQVLVQTSPYPDTGISEIDRTAIILTLGGRYRWGKNHIEFSFTEDLNTTGAPDFIFQLGFKRTF